MKVQPLRAASALAAAGMLAAIAACGGGGGGGGAPAPVPPPPLSISTVSLAAGTVGVGYSQTVVATGGTVPRTFSVSAGALPAGLALAAGTGVVSGTPAGPPGTANFTISVVDAGVPQQSDSQALSITINAVAVGRNDSIATATPIGNGDFAASISPSGHPNSVFNPDQDFYRLVTTAASTVTVDIDAQVNGSPLDPVIEIVNAAGVRLNTCALPGQVTFNSPCVHDDEDPGVQRDSLLRVQVAGATTFFVRVLDWRGDGRPDQTYLIRISGVI
ncbi:MAG: putative Ig domain-containing protein [Gammaproteobacteria bacterium]